MKLHVMKVAMADCSKSMAKLGLRVAPDGRLSPPFSHTATSKCLPPAFGRMLVL